MKLMCNAHPSCVFESGRQQQLVAAAGAGAEKGIVESQSFY